MPHWSRYLMELYLLHLSGLHRLDWQMDSPGHPTNDIAVEKPGHEAKWLMLPIRSKILSGCICGDFVEVCRELGAAAAARTRGKSENI